MHHIVTGGMLALICASGLRGSRAAQPGRGADRDGGLEANKEIGRRILVEVWGEGKLEVVDELVAPDYVDHTPHGPEPQQVEGPEGLKQAVRQFRAAFPDLTYRVEFQVAEGDLVATGFSATGTQLHPFQNIPATGQRVRYTGIDVSRIAAGKIVEAWVNYDALGLLQDLGVTVEPPALEGSSASSR